MGFDGVMSTNHHDEYLSNLQATADRRLELLKDGKEWIYRILMDAGWVDIPHDGLAEYLRKLEKELSDEA